MCRKGLIMPFCRKTKKSRNAAKGGAAAVVFLDIDGVGCATLSTRLSGLLREDFRLEKS